MPLTNIRDKMNAQKFNLKEKIKEILSKRKHTYEELAHHIGVQTSELDFFLQNNTLEIRQLELISKALRIPLYSFFRQPGNDNEILEEAVYMEKLWSSDDSSFGSDISRLRSELKNLREQIAEKNLIIEKLEAQIQKPY